MAGLSGPPLQGLKNVSDRWHQSPHKATLRRQVGCSAPTKSAINSTSASYWWKTDDSFAQYLLWLFVCLWIPTVHYYLRTVCIWSSHPLFCQSKTSEIQRTRKYGNPNSPPEAFPDHLEGCPGGEDDPGLYPGHSGRQEHSFRVVWRQSAIPLNEQRCIGWAFPLVKIHKCIFHLLSFASWFKRNEPLF